MQALGFHHLAIQVRDVERVSAFYRTVLGLAEVKRWHRDDGSLRSVWVSVGGESGFLAIEHLPEGVTVPDGALGPSMIALRIAPAARRGIEVELAAHGVPIVKQTGWTLYVRDPEGTLVGLSHHPFDVP